MGSITTFKGYVYQITNTVDGKIYIGQTIRKLEHRLYLHGYKKSRCLYLKNAIHKFGIESFKIEAIETVESDNKEELFTILDSKEKCHIKDRDSMFPNGYNLTDGGRRSIMSQDAIRRRSLAHCKPIKCNETGQTWPSVKDCATYFNVKPKQISKVLKGQRKRLKWAYTFSYVSSNL